MAMRSGNNAPGRMVLLALALAALLSLGSLCACARESPTQASSSSIDTVALDKQAIRESLQQELSILNSPSAQALEGLLAPENCEMASHLLRGFSYEIGAIDVGQDQATARVKITCLDVSDVVDKGIASMTAGDELQENAGLYDSFEEEDRKAFVRHVFKTLYEQIDATTAMKSYETVLHLTRDAKTNAWSVNEDDVVALIDGLFAV